MTLMAIKANATVRDMVEPHVASIEACAAAMRAAGIGAHPTGGHAGFLDRMAGSMRAEAARGVVPSAYFEHPPPFTASKIEGNPKMEIETRLYAKEGETAVPMNIAAMKASSHFRGVAYLLRKHNIAIEKTMNIGEFDVMIRAAMLPPSERIILKSALSRAGILV